MHDPVFLLKTFPLCIDWPVGKGEIAAIWQDKKYPSVGADIINTKVAAQVLEEHVGGVCNPGPKQSSRSLGQAVDKKGLWDCTQRSSTLHRDLRTFQIPKGPLDPRNLSLGYLQCAQSVKTDRLEKG